MDPIVTIVYIICFIFSVVLHELAHGYTAYALGDTTARDLGRLTLNPIRHLELVGSFLIPGFLILSGSPIVIGWAKPIPFDPSRLRNKRYGPALVAIAGPVANIAIAISCAIIVRTLGTHLGEIALMILSSIVYSNVALAFFNLIPVPPLDGHHILLSLLPAQSPLQSLYYGGSVIIFIILAVAIWRLLSPLAFIFANVLLGS